MNPKITVHGSEKRHFLRVHFSAGAGGILRFESERTYTKAEADYRAIMLSSEHGFERDALPTHPGVEPYPAITQGEAIDQAISNERSKP